MSDKETLLKFLNFDLPDGESVLNEFGKLHGAIHIPRKDGFDDFVYIPGSRDDRVVLVAHADTVAYDKDMPKTRVVIESPENILRSGTPKVGIGADDRAGCAIVYLLKDLGHSILITNGEENGNTCAKQMKIRHRDIVKELNRHQYILEFDNGGVGNFKTYNIPVTEQFVKYIERCTGCKRQTKNVIHTDISQLCERICGANLSIGYYDKHWSEEKLHYTVWKDVLDNARDFLSKSQPKFKLDI